VGEASPTVTTSASAAIAWSVSTVAGQGSEIIDAQPAAITIADTAEKSARTRARYLVRLDATSVARRLQPAELWRIY
jgi:hypothetical protein